MKSIGPLMIEHRLIERMVALLKKALSRLENKENFNPQFIFDAVDFFRTYADRTHHGKEEDILFEELKNKKISNEHKRIMDELIQEHILARENVKGLLEANEQYVKGDSKEVDKIMGFLKTLVKLYPPHIKKEDTQFFLPIMDYFTEEEQQNMLKKFFEFDRQIIHEKYKGTVEKYEKM
ncbi:hemerythrin domain-containing protein [Candidatus Woesearchaeota archaeon]|nr:hemerythrin domain-containing protein [Candidatus Woesearchaeota archaeon]